MKYDRDAATREILLRAERLRGRRERAVTRALGGACAGLLALIVLCVGAVSGAGSPPSGRSAYGAFLLPSAAGGYVLAGVLAFVAGVVVTALCLRVEKNKAEKQTRQSTEKKRDSQ